MIYKLIYLFSNIYTLLIFLGKPYWIFTLILFILYSIILIKRLRVAELIVISFIIITIIYNYFEIQKIHYFFGPTLNNFSIMQYILVLLFILSGLRSFSYKEFFEKIYLINRKYKKLLAAEVILVYLYYLILFITRRGFVVHNGSSIYAGVYTSPHPMGYTLLILIIITAYLSKHYTKKMALFYPLAILLLVYTSARAPTIIGIVLTIFLNIKIENKIEIRKMIMGAVAIITFILVTIFHEVVLKLIINTPMIEKFQITSTKSILSGRDDFWPLLINDYLYKFNLIEKLFGHGVYYSMYLNFKNYNMVIWAHNDILDIIISFGMIIMLIYLYSYLKYFRYFFNKCKEKPKVILITVCTLSLMLLNGIVNYPFFLMFFFHVGTYFIDSIGGQTNEVTILH